MVEETSTHSHTLITEEVREGKFRSRWRGKFRVSGIGRTSLETRVTLLPKHIPCQGRGSIDLLSGVLHSSPRTGTSRPGVEVVSYRGRPKTGSETTTTRYQLDPTWEGRGSRPKVTETSPTLSSSCVYLFCRTVSRSLLLPPRRGECIRWFSVSNL